MFWDSLAMQPMLGWNLLCIPGWPLFNSRSSCPSSPSGRSYRLAPMPMYWFFSYLITWSCRILFVLGYCGSLLASNSLSLQSAGIIGRNPSLIFPTVSVIHCKYLWSVGINGVRHHAQVCAGLPVTFPSPFWFLGSYYPMSEPKAVYHAIGKARFCPYYLRPQ